MLDKRLLDILICPKCKGELVYDEERDILICKKDGIYFEIKNNIPIMLLEKAKNSMKNKILIFTLILLTFLLNNAKIVSFCDEKGVVIEYFPKDENVSIYDLEYENGYLVKNIYVNVPEGDVEVKVKSEKFEIGKNYFTGLSKNEKLFEKNLFTLQIKGYFF